ncbi:MAG TPA: glycosyltransferase [bacterium]|nr:glycosyltransferase [bacterium]
MKSRYGRPVYLAWAPFNRRADSFASHFNAELCLVHYFKYRSPEWALFKYPLMAAKTLAVLRKKRPGLVMAMSPPLFCAWIAHLFCALYGCKLVIDAHTGSLISFPWTMFRFLHKFLCKRALLTIVTNDHLVRLVESWGGETIIMNPPIDFPEAGKKRLKSNSILVVNTFAMDEPLDEILLAASNLPEVHFYVTGRVDGAQGRRVRNAPDNVYFTDFIPYEEYVSMLKSVDVVLALTNRDFTLQSGGMEAMYMGKPLVTSRFPYLMSHFYQGTLYAVPEAEDIAEKLLEALKHRKKLSRQMETMREAHSRDWEKKVQSVNEKWMMADMKQGG